MKPQKMPPTQETVKASIFILLNASSKIALIIYPAIARAPPKDKILNKPRENMIYRDSCVDTEMFP